MLPLSNIIKEKKFTIELEKNIYKLSNFTVNKGKYCQHPLRKLVDYEKIG